MRPYTSSRETAQHLLRTMLHRAGLNLNMLDLEKTWDVFINFCNIPIECNSDGVLIQWGNTYKPRRYYEGKKEHTGFYYSVLRQFDDAYGYEYEQLTIEWHYPLNKDIQTTIEKMRRGSSDWCFSKEVDRSIHCDPTLFLQLQRTSYLFKLFASIKPLKTRVCQNST